jgi:two-component system cell cycle sensor histidine kinase/response regulator CckA
VLLVDDELHIRALVKAFLMSENFEVIEAGDGLEAFDLIQAGSLRLDLIITDIKMPRMDGVALAHAVATALPQVPVLFFSGYALGTEIGPQLKGPKREFLPKPFLRNALIDKINSLLV